MQSIIQARGYVEFPSYLGERIYMEPFTKREGLPSHLTRWQQTVDMMLDGIDADGPIYLMVDQSPVAKGQTQRRPGIHIDGYWNAGLSMHQQGHTSRPHHRSHPFHGPTPRHFAKGDWSTATFDEPEGIILASDVMASKAYVGEFSGPIGDMGDCANVDVSGLEAVFLKPWRVYAGNVSMLHESTPVAEDCLRTLVRLNVSGWTPH